MELEENFVRLSMSLFVMELLFALVLFIPRIGLTEYTQQRE